MGKHLFFFIVLVATVLWGSSAYAQSEDSLRHLPSRSVEVTTSRETELPVLDPRAARIKATATAASQTGASILSNALRSVSSSLSVRRYGTLGSIALPSFRGLPVEYTILYRDGVRVTNEQGGYTDLGQLSLHGLRMIEVIPASSAMLLGGDAIGAAINVESAVRDTAVLRIGTEQTGYQRGTGLPEASYYALGSITPSPGLSFIAGVSRDRSTGAFPFFQDTEHPVVLRENNDASLWTANLSGLWTPDTSTIARFSSSYFTIDRGVPGEATTPGRGASVLNVRQGDRQMYASGRIDRAFGAWLTSLTLSAQDQQITYRSPSYGTNDTSRNQIFGCDLRAIRPINERVKLFGGLDLLHSRLSGTTNRLPNGDSVIGRDRLAGYVGSHLLPADQVTLDASLRVESITAVSAIEFLPQVAARYQALDELAFDAAFSRSFHAPTLNALYWSGPLVVPNPGLHSERGSNIQAGVQYQPTWWPQTTLSLTGFRADIQGQIIWLTKGSSTSPINLDHIRTSGLELRVETSVSLGREWTLGVEESYTVLDARNLTEDTSYLHKELPYTTPTSSLFIGQVSHPMWGSLAALVSYRGHRFFEPTNNFGALPPVTTIDLTLSSAEFSMSGLGMHVMLSVQNLTDRSYQEVKNYPLPERTFKFSIELNYH